ncbi:hypothetical protein GCM10010329_54610 [Streptomyces spiroverticillatus]|uniref:Uncharacterized protein n=1 Tax=Streptomyces finlayi TaxID=67296 RepID=A0A919CCE2_9ACTN|nr:hypothetical protein [Streptomyces finlayi]GHA24341.1 hypothetical protein GCM10010329_54610 [Streptomyces spiroverticillatus]GHD05929.1 hypothetical protein GCM10010334_57190 [Streptomyces finlayi]
MFEYEFQARHTELVRAAAHDRLLRAARQARKEARRAQSVGKNEEGAPSGLRALRDHFTHAA